LGHLMSHGHDDPTHVDSRRPPAATPFVCLLIRGRSQPRRAHAVMTVITCSRRPSAAARPDRRLCDRPVARLATSSSR
jgi:hypothetical protein